MTPLPRPLLVAIVREGDGQTIMRLCFPGDPSLWADVPVTHVGRTARETRAAAAEQLAAMAPDDLAAVKARAVPGPQPHTVMPGIACAITVLTPPQKDRVTPHVPPGPTRTTPADSTPP